MFKRFWKKIKKTFIWMFSRKVLEAINEGASYAEVEALVEELAR